VSYGCHVANAKWPPGSDMKEKKWGLLTCSNEDSDNDMHCHRPDNVARLLMCQVVPHPSLVAMLAKVTPASCVKKGEGLGRYTAHLG
jgi:hypothetical protein